MKTLVFATMMCIAAMSAKAQVITSETVNNVYEEMTNKTTGDFYYNAEMTGESITTMYVYQQVVGCTGMETLKPYMKYEYTYATDGTLTSRVTYRWTDIQDSWLCTGRHDYTLADGKYYAEYSHYNYVTNSFDLPMERMVYSLKSGGHVDNVGLYHRDDPSALFLLIGEISVTDYPMLFAER